MSALANRATLEREQRGIERSQIVQHARLGLVPYQTADAWQRVRAQQIARGERPEIVLLLEHPAVYTQGRRGGREHVLHALNAPIVDTDRGGDLTFHGPGQLVLWPLLRLRERGIGIAAYIRGLEDIAIRTASAFGVDADRAAGRPGAWIGNRKLASVGVRIQSGVSRHGMAFNCHVDLSWFDSIRACGIADSTATSLSAELETRVTVDECAAVLEQCVAEVFDLKLSPVSELRIGE
ncbi:MAG: lipoyl(octanoyl) transferase LipB [Chloroflexi bacterium]|nr:lipoyl(octanoyl) transferase LipB [Chloroflexota bacterium]MCY3587503.1 lipoyl(octanoyl) transferase LipB [Chloroflexota bacterium]MCY3685534.1 lipoyl(octanoyl) transferase LipB [Chloroflexota bacterium]MDE2708436.1 lipoyl(octanoyl) transferase LipB [Chloroflexota bacterium]